MISLVLSTANEQRERPAVRVTSCCTRAVRLACIVTRTPTCIILQSRGGRCWNRHFLSPIFPLYYNQVLYYNQNIQSSPNRVKRGLPTVLQKWAHTNSNFFVPENVGAVVLLTELRGEKPVGVRGLAELTPYACMHTGKGGGGQRVTRRSIFYVYGSGWMLRVEPNWPCTGGVLTLLQSSFLFLLFCCALRPSFVGRCCISGDAVVVIFNRHVALRWCWWRVGRFSGGADDGGGVRCRAELVFAVNVVVVAVVVAAVIAVAVVVLLLLLLCWCSFGCCGSCCLKLPTYSIHSLTHLRSYFAARLAVDAYRIPAPPRACCVALGLPCRTTKRRSSKRWGVRTRHRRPSSLPTSTWALVRRERAGGANSALQLQ